VSVFVCWCFFFFDLICWDSFNQGEGQEENAIVTSSGQYVIAWDFAKVKKGRLDQYEIKKYEDQVVQDNFKFGDDKEIVCLFFPLCGILMREIIFLTRLSR
jgi:hypothetical protein